METVGCSTPTCGCFSASACDDMGRKEANELPNETQTSRYMAVTFCHQAKWEPVKAGCRPSQPIHSPQADHVWLPYYVFPRISLHLKGMVDTNVV